MKQINICENEQLFKIPSLTPSAAAAAVVAALLAGPAMAEAPPLRVLATVGMIADVAATVAGDCATVEALIGPGSDPHLYQPTASDVTRLRDAELIFYVAPELEAQLAAVLRRFSERTPTVGLVEAAFATEDLLTDEDGIDPHLWMDVGLWARTVPTVAAAIAEARPGCAEAVAERAAAYQAQLAALHGWVADSIATIPEGRRLLVTAHDAFEYFSRAYGIEASEAIEGLSTESEASIADIRAVAAFVVERGVPAVFVETTINPRTIEAMIAEARSLGHAVAIGGSLYSDAMGEDGTPAGSYIGMIWHNAATIVEALGGTPPPLPDALAPWAATWGLDR